MTVPEVNGWKEFHRHGLNLLRHSMKRTEGGKKTLRVSLGCFVLPHPSVLTASQSSLSQKYNVKIMFIASKNISTADSSLRDMCGSHSGNVHVQLQDAWMSRRLQYEDKLYFASVAFFMMEFSSIGWNLLHAKQSHAGGKYHQCLNPQ